MRRLTAWLSVAVFASGCTVADVPASPSPSYPSQRISIRPIVDAGNWSPWFFFGWQPGLGQPLVPGLGVDAIVTAGDECVPNIRWTWDARTSCTRFVTSVSASGWLDAFLTWDPTAPGFNPALSGDVVLVAPDGRFTASDWQHTEEHIFGRVEPVGGFQECRSHHEVLVIKSSSLNDSHKPMEPLGCRFHFDDIALVQLNIFKCCNERCPVGLQMNSCGVSSRRAEVEVGKMQIG